jgi:hypothetical protein
MLPKIQYPIFSLHLPISKKSVRYRPMLVREEKMLLVAKESNTAADIINNMVQVVQNCLLDNIDVDSLPMAEFEYLFVNVRARSIGNIIELKYYDTYDRSVKHDVSIEVDNIKIDIPKKFNTKIMVSDSIGVMMKVPNVSLARNIKASKDLTEIGLDFACDCIDYIFDQDQVYSAADYSKEELLDFIESLPPKEFEKLENFFTYLPTLKYSTSFKNTKGEDVKVNLTRLEDFF